MTTRKEALRIFKEIAEKAGAKVTLSSKAARDMKAPSGCCDDHEYDRDLAMAKHCARAAFQEALRNQPDEELAEIVLQAAQEIVWELLHERRFEKRWLIK